MQGQSTSQGGALGRPEAFKYFLWRRHRQRGALDGFVPEVLATDGETVRRMLAEKGQLLVQQFGDVQTAEAIVSAVESRSTVGGGLLGYSMFADADALAIMHTGSAREAGWLAFPYVGSGRRGDGRPSGIPTLPLLIDQLPSIRLVGGAELCWRDCRLVFDAAVEQRGDVGETPEQGGLNLLDHLVGWRLETTVMREHEATRVRLFSRRPVDGIRRSGPGRAEAGFEVDRQLLNQLGERSDLKAWFVLEFGRGLLCLPSDWCKWWFEVDFPQSPRC